MVRDGDGRFLGIDLGAETIKIVEVVRRDGVVSWTRRRIREHRKEPGRTLLEMLGEFDPVGASGAAVTGRLGRMVNLPRIPVRQAQAAGWRHERWEGPATLVSIGAHGFSVLELRPGGAEAFRENSRCSQGTGNFLRQLVERLGLGIAKACEAAAAVTNPAALSGRCPVILKTDLTHLANKGEPRERIVAGLLDAVCQNVLVLLKPGLSPSPVALLGGVGRATRVRDLVRRHAVQHGMAFDALEPESAVFLEALGAAVQAGVAPVPGLDGLLAPPSRHEFDALPALSASLPRVRRLPAPPPFAGPPSPVVLGLDIGSTGSKIVALDPGSRTARWQAYVPTGGKPVEAAQQLVKEFVAGPAAECPVAAVAVTGSGREIAGSLLATCYGAGRVYILNEIAAHAEGALARDPRVDTIFEIGGQDAKYIRLAGGRIADAAMNEACSAGTGSFIEEQGRKFSGIRDVAHLGAEALAANRGVSLGQHCSVFMAEIIDEAVAAGEETSAIVAGIYDSIIRNYLNRVKGSRTVGSVIFCQGMPFASDALAAAVARQTGSEVIVPPSPGHTGALGIALLAAREMALTGAPLDPFTFLGAKVVRKEEFHCGSNRGCGGTGNKCRIDAITTEVAGVSGRFTWGGACSLYDKGTRTRKLPDLAPDPFRERAELMRRFADPDPRDAGRPTVALSDEFVLKGIFPFFATFLRELGFAPRVAPGGDRAQLKRGIERAQVPFCAPMQLYHGLADAMAGAAPDLILLPRLRRTGPVADEPNAVLCPIVQASADIVGANLERNGAVRIVSTVMDLGAGGTASSAFIESCGRLAADLGARGADWRAAHRIAATAQAAFDAACLDAGHAGLAFCEAEGILPVVVLGRPYTIHNTVLNSNVPALLREQGAMAIPVDCYPLDDGTPVFPSIFWGYGQRILRAAHHVRRAPGRYAVYCSNYACGPDSFLLHFYAHQMEGRPYAIIETDGHAGDAGTKTRIEAFLHCARGDAKAHTPATRPPRNFRDMEGDGSGLDEIRQRGETVLIPRMGVSAGVLAACLRGAGIPAERLPVPDRDALERGRRHTSGKECLPMIVTLGSLLQRLDRETDPARRFSFMMPTARGPCRFGAYNLLHRIVLTRLGHADRVRLWSPADANYFDGLPAGFDALVFGGFMAGDLLLEALYHTRPAERVKGAAQAAYAASRAELLALLEREAANDLSTVGAVWRSAAGDGFGLPDLLRRAAARFERVPTDDVRRPTVLLVGEIYVRCDPFASDFIVDKLEARGLRVRFAPFNEWIEYTDFDNATNHGEGSPGKRIANAVRGRIQDRLYRTIAEPLGWPDRTTVRQSLAAAEGYLKSTLSGEAVLTVGGPVHEWRAGLIDGVVSVGPHECMPTKLAEAQFHHAAEREGLLSLTVPLNGDPVDPEILDAFAFAVRAKAGRVPAAS